MLQNTFCKKVSKLNKKRIVLPESEDLRILKAASKITLDNIADIILVGNKEVILKTCADHNIDISNVKIVNNLKDVLSQEVACIGILAKNTNVVYQKYITGFDNISYFKVFENINNTGKIKE